MRKIGELPSEEQARTFEDYLVTRGMQANIEQADGDWAVWIVEEDHLDQARRELAEFTENPTASRFAEGARAAADLRRQQEKKEKQARKNQVNMRERWSRPMSARAPVTTTLIGISLFVVAFGTDWNRAFESGPLSIDLCNDPESFVPYLFFAPVELTGDGRGTWVPAEGLQAIRQGQLWRLVTPMFLHFGPLHILFNMLWLRDLGGVIEMRRGRLRFLAMVLAIALLSNVAQFFSGGPMFGGMSGVVFGLFGYIWIKSRYEPESGFHMPPNLVFLMIAWFVICFTGMVGPIANAAHGVGLATGMVVAYVPTFWRKMQGR